jgi:hypothetical protein
LKEDERPHLQMGTAMGAAILSTKGGLSVENAALVFL